MEGKARKTKTDVEGWDIDYHGERVYGKWRLNGS